MNTKIKVVSMIAVIAAIFTAVTPVFADDGTGFDFERGNGERRETLGLTVEEFKALRESGMTMQEICEQQGVECPQKANGGRGGGKDVSGQRLEKLGLTAEEFKALRQSGLKMQEICEQQGVECLPNKGNGDWSNR